MFKFSVCVDWPNLFIVPAEKCNPFSISLIHLHVYCDLVTTGRFVTTNILIVDKPWKNLYMNGNKFVIQAAGWKDLGKIVVEYGER